MMWPQELLLALQALALFLGLSCLYWLIFKVPHWQSPFVLALTARVRLWAYLLIPLFTAFWSLQKLAGLPNAAWHPSGNILAISESALLIVLAISAVEACSGLVFDYLLAIRRHTMVPVIVRSLTRGIVYTALFFFFLPHFFAWRNVAGLITSSAIVSLILGLALQETLGNLFAGITMQISRPYQTGHWIKIGAYEGQVERADWRSMTLRTLEGDQVSFPHSLLAKMEIRNYSFPSTLHACETQVSVHYRHPPSTVETILTRCALETPGVRAQPSPEVRLTAYQDFAILYTIQFWIDDFARYQDIESDVLKRIWYLFRRESIEIPYPIRELHRREERRKDAAAADHVQLLQRIEFLAALNDEQRSLLAQRLAPQLFARGEIIFRQGDPGNTFHIIKHGQVEATVQSSDGHTIHGRVMKAGDYFGEVSLLTGEPRSATIRAAEDTEVLTMGKEDMRRLLETNSQLAEHVSRTLTQRQQIIREQWILPEQPEGHNGAIQEHHAESLRRELLGRIVRFFSY